MLRFDDFIEISKIFTLIPVVKDGTKSTYIKTPLGDIFYVTQGRLSYGSHLITKKKKFIYMVKSSVEM